MAHSDSGTTRRGGRRRRAGSSPSETWLAFRNAFFENPAEHQIGQIRDGIEAGYLVGAAAALGVSRETLFDLVGIPASTAKRKLANEETLDSGATERLIRIGAIEKLAEETFGDVDTAIAWLRARNVGLGNVSPLALLDTEIGCREVARILNSIAYGGAA